jgi:hypothetical protein
MPAARYDNAVAHLEREPWMDDVEFLPAARAHSPARVGHARRASGGHAAGDTGDEEMI